MFANFGTKVTIFEAAPQFLPREDRDIAQAITRILQEKGVELILNANVQAVSSKEGAVQVETPEGAHLVDACWWRRGENRRRLAYSCRTPAWR